MRHIAKKEIMFLIYYREIFIAVAATAVVIESLDTIVSLSINHSMATFKTIRVLAIYARDVSTIYKI